MEERNAKVYSDEQLAAELKNKRAAGRGAKALSIAGVILVVAGLLTTLISVAIFGVILCLVGALVMNRREKSMKQQIGDQLVQGLLENVFEEVDYQPTGHISRSAMDAAVLPVDFHTVEGSNDVKAVYKAMHVEMSGVTLIQENDYYNDDAGMWETVKGEVFKGQWLVCDFGHEFSTELRIVARTGIKRLFSGSVVKTDNEEFDKKFIIQPENEQEVGNILTPHIVDCIVSMSFKYGGKLYMSFLKKGQLHIAVQTDQPFFALSRGKVEVDALRQKYQSELHWFTDFLDELNWVDTLYLSKETSTCVRFEPEQEAHEKGEEELG